MATFSERLKEIRTARGMTQQELAQLLGYKGGRSVICMIETGKRTVTLDRMREFALVLGVDPAYLIGWDDSEQPPTMTPAEARLLRSFAKLNTTGKKKATEYINDLLDSPNYRL